MILPLTADWFIGTLATLFLTVIDTIFYGLLVVSYNIFYAVAQIDLFGGGTAGETLYNEITRRLYMVLSIIMVFVFAYQLIMLVIDPDGKSKGSSSHVVKDTLFSIILLIVLPLVYRYMAMFQFHVLENNTIPAIILGTNAGGQTENPGKSVATMVLVSFFHPNGTTYSTFYDENGQLRSNAVELCEEDTFLEDGKKYTDACEMYTKALESWDDKAGVTALTATKKKLRDWIGEKMSYTWIISSIAALAIAWVFFLYAIDIGVRAVKLGVLQLISPIPVILRIFPNTKKSFDTWFNHMKKTYLELFIRVAIIFFGLEIVKLIPTFIEIIFQSQSSSVAGPFTKCIATVILILGILRFIQDAPALFKELFSAGGNLFSGLKLNAVPGKNAIKSRLTENKALMWGLGKGSAAIGGGKSQLLRTKNVLDENSINAENKSHGFRNTVYSLPAALRGVVTGVMQKDTTPTDLTGAAIRQSFYKGTDSANQQYDEKYKERTEIFGEYVRHATENGMPGSVKTDRDTSTRENIAGYIKQRVDYHNKLQQEKNEINKEIKENTKSHIRGEFSTTSSTADSLSKIVKELKEMKSMTDDKTKSLNKKIEEQNRILNSYSGNVDNRPTRGQYFTEEAFKDAFIEWSKANDAKNRIEELKQEKNKIIGENLTASDEARKYTTSILQDVYKEIQKLPGIGSDDKQYKEINDQYKEMKQFIDTVTSGSQLSASQIKDMNDMIDKFSNSMKYVQGSKDFAQQKASSSTNQTKGDTGSKPASGGSGGKK